MKQYQFTKEHIEEVPEHFELLDEVEWMGELDKGAIGFVVEVTDDQVVVYWPNDMNEAEEYDLRFAHDHFKKTGKKVSTLNCCQRFDYVPL